MKTRSRTTTGAHGARQRSQAPQHTRAARSRKKVFYREELSSDSSHGEEGQDDEEVEKEEYEETPQTSQSPTHDLVLPSRSRGQPPAPPVKEPFNISSKRRIVRRRSRSPITSFKKTRTVVGAVRRENKAHEVSIVDPILALGGSIPAWQSLPYEILLQIFQYATYPLVDDAGQPTPSIKWLLRTALLCRGFAEPALAALYYSPPLSPPDRARRLIDQLCSHSVGGGLDPTFNYRGKIHYLDIDGFALLDRKSNGHDPMRLVDIVREAPQLKGVDLHAGHVYRGMGYQGFKRNAIDEELVEELEKRKRPLRCWTWDSKMQPWSEWSYARETAPFRDLQRLKIVDLDKLVNKPPSKGPTDFNFESPGLTQLSIQSSIMVDDNMLQKIPKQLRSLEVVDCPVSSAGVQQYLQGHGQHIQELSLHHNRSLNLSFLTDLATSCPGLQVLKMNLTYFKQNMAFRDIEPRYPALLLPGERPTWPSKLRHIELLYLRKWSLSTADAFFSSLIDSAPNLLDLRHLEIKASLTESSWRDRIAFRDQWTNRLQHVFVRTSKPPSPCVSTLASLKRQKALASSLVESRGLNPEPRKADQTGEKSFETASRKILRPRKGRKMTVDASSTDSEDELTQAKSAQAADSPVENLYIQGMCDFVHVLIDNLRPGEEHYKEDDFLDDEISGDEDWDGDEDMGNGESYAW